MSSFFEVQIVAQTPLTSERPRCVQNDMAAVAYLKRILGSENLNLNFNRLLLVVWNWAHYLTCVVFIFLICNTKAKLLMFTQGYCED